MPDLNTYYNVSEVDFSLRVFEEEQTKKNLKEFNQQKVLIKNIALVLSLASYSALALGIVLLSSVPLWVSISLLLEAIVTGSIYLLAYFIARSSKTTKRLKVAIYLMLLTLFLAVSAGQILLGSGGGMSAAFLIIAVLANMAGLGVGEVIVTSIISIILMIVFQVLQNNLSVYTPALNLMQYPLVDELLWLNIALVICAGITLFTYRIKLNNQSNDELVASKTQALLKLQQTVEASTSLVREVNRTTTELSSAATQQATSAQEQASATSQIGSSMEELSETASQIANSARSVALAATQMVAIGQEVQAISEATLSRAQEGNQAVAAAIHSINRAKQRIELIGQRLLNLTEQIKRVTSTVSIIDELADETHLLALNASIEAAGSIIETAFINTVANPGSSSTFVLSPEINNTTSRKRQGERFNIISQEIKNLADRCRELTEEVRQAISEMQGALAAAVLVAEEGKKAGTDAVLRAEIAGAVIDQMSNNAQDHVYHFDKVVEMAKEVRQRCDEISLATGQQRSANVQIVQTIRSLSDVAQQTSDNAGVISSAVEILDTKVVTLNELINSSKL